MSGKPYLIKRYQRNRRLYDLQAHDYTDWDKVRRLVHQGHEVQILDHPTGKDVTAFVFMQILTDAVEANIPVLPLQELRCLVSDLSRVIHVVKA